MAPNFEAMDRKVPVHPSPSTGEHLILHAAAHAAQFVVSQQQRTLLSNIDRYKQLIGRKQQAYLFSPREILPRGTKVAWPLNTHRRDFADD